MLSQYKPVFKNSKFIYLWLSQVFCEFTINIMNFVLLVHLFNTTGSTVAASFIYLSYAFPAILIGPFAAATVDLVDRRKLLMFANLLQALAVFGYSFIYDVRPFLLYTLTFSYSLLNQFYVPAQAASLPSLVEKKALPQANGIYFLTQQSSIVVGFGLAGFINHILGFRNSLILCASFLLLAFISSSFLPSMKPKIIGKVGFEEGAKRFFGRMLEGYQFIKGNPHILTPFGIFLGLQIALIVLVVNVPAISEDIFKIKANSAGLAVIVPGAVGALVGAVLVPKFLNRQIRKKRVIETSFVIMGVALLILAAIVPAVSGTPRLIAGTLSIFTAGIGFTGILIPVQTFLQESTPEGLFGRVFGNMWFLITFLTILPVFFSGAITDLLGIRTLLFIFAIGIGVVVTLSKKYGQRLLNMEARNEQI